MANEFLTEVDLEFHGNFEEIEAQASAALDKIASKADEAARGGGSLSGLTEATRTVGSRVARAGTQAGFGPAEVSRLSQLFDRFNTGFQRLSSSFRPQDLSRQFTDVAGRRDARANRSNVTAPAALATDAQAFADDQAELRRQNAAGNRALRQHPTYLQDNAQAETESKLTEAAKNNALTNSKYPEAVAKASAEANDLAAAMDQAKAGSEHYIDSTVNAATQLASRTAAENAAKAADQDYIDATASATAALKLRQAAETEASATQANANSDARTAVARNRQNVRVQQKTAELTTPEDTRAAGIAQASTAALRVATELEALRSVTQQDATASGELIVARKQQAADVELAAQADVGYKKAVGDSIAALKQRQAIEAEAAATQQNANADARTAVARNRQRTQVQQKTVELTTPEDTRAAGIAQASTAALRVATELEALASTTQQDITASGVLSVAKRQQAADVELAAQADAGYANSIRDTAAALKRRQQTEAEVAASNESIASTARTEALRNRTRSATQQQVTALTTPEDIRAAGVAQAGSAATKAATELEALASTTQEDIATSGQLIVAKKQQAADIQLAAQADTGYAQAIRDTITVLKQRQAAEALAAGSADNITTTAEAEVARNRTRTATQQQVTALTTPEDIKATGETQASIAGQKLAVQLAALGARTQQDITTEAKLIILKQEQTKLLQQELDQQRGQVATRFQNLQQRLNPGSGGATSQRTIGQFFGEHAVRTASYAVPGIAFGAGIEELRSSIQEAEQAQVAFAHLDAQFHTLGQGNQLPAYTADIKELASATGLATSEVATLALQMKGVYGSTAEAEVALKGVSEAAIGLQLNLAEAGQDITAITQGFSDLSDKGGKATAIVANEAANAQNQFGVNGGQVLSGVADIAPVASQLGLTSNQTTALIAGTAQRSGQPVDTISENLSRILPQFTDSIGQIGTYYRTLPTLQGKSATAFNNDVTSGNTSQAFLQFLSDFKSIPKNLQDSIAEDLGDVRYTPTLIAASENAQKINQVGNAPPPADAAKNAYDEQQKTLANTFDRVRADFTNLGVEILDSGVGTAINDVALGFGDLAKVLGDLNGVTGGHLGQLVAFVAAVKGITFAVGQYQNIKAASDGLRTWIANLGATSETTTGKIEAENVANATLGNSAEVTTGKLEVESAANVVGGASAAAGGVEEAGGAVAAGETAAAPAAAVGASAILPATIAGVLGYQLGSFISKRTALPEQIDHLFTGGPSNKFSSGQQQLTDNEINQLSRSFQGIETLLSPQQLSQFQSELSGAQKGSISDYTKALTTYNQLAVTPQGKTAVDSVPTPAPGLPQPFTQAPLSQASVNNSASDLPVGDAVKSQDIAGAGTFNTSPGIQSVAKGLLASLTAKAVQQAQAQSETLAENAAGATASQSNISDLASYQGAGVISMQTYIAALQHDATYYETLAKDNQGGQTAADTAAQLAQTLASAQDQVAAQNQAIAQSLITGNTAQADKSKLQQALVAAQTAITTTQANTDVTAVIAQLTQAQQDAVANAQTGAQALAAGTATIQLPPGLSSALAKIGYKGPTALTQTQSDSTKLQELNQDTQTIQAQATAQATENPVAVALAAYNAANAELTNAVTAGYQKNSTAYQTAAANVQTQATTLFDAREAVAAASVALTKAYATAGGNVLAAAQADQQAAQVAIASAHGQAAQLQAQAQAVAANQEVVTAMNTLASGQAAVVTAQANAAGSPQGIIAAAANQAKVDQENIQRLEAADQKLGQNPATDVNVQQALATFYNDQATAVSTLVQQTIQQQESLLFLGKTTATQAIATLEAQIPAVKGNQTELLALETEIRQIQDSTGSNLNFNLPSSLLVNPTLYESRRVQDLGGQTYQGSVQVTVNVNNPSQNPGAVNTILKAMGGGSSTIGTTAPVIGN